MPMNIREIGPLLEHKVSEWAKNSDESVETVMHMVLEATMAWFEDNGLHVDTKCPVHEGQIHGGEAEELRRGIEEIIKGIDDETDVDGEAMKADLQKLIDKTDARDSLAHIERLKGKMEPSRDSHAQLLRVLQALGHANANSAEYGWDFAVRQIEYFVKTHKELIDSGLAMEKKLESFEQVRLDVLKAMGVKGTQHTWSWITAELAGRHSWMLKARDQGRGKMDDLLNKIDRDHLFKAGPAGPNINHVDLSRVRLMKAGFSQPLLIGDRATIVADGIRYQPAIVVEVTADSYVFQIVNEDSDELKKRINEARWEGWSALLSLVYRDHSPGEERVVAKRGGMKLVQRVIRGYDHRDLMRKEFPDA